DADVEVGHERDRPSTLSRGTREDDRARLRDRNGAAGDDTVHQIELERRPAAVVDQFELGRTPRVRKAGRHHETRHRTFARSGRDGLGDARRPANVSAIVADALAEAPDPRGGIEYSTAAVSR